MAWEIVASIAALVVAAVALWTAWAARKHPKHLEDAMKVLSKIAQTQQKQLETLARSVELNASQQTRAQALKEQEILLRQQRQNWDLWVGIAKLLGWAYDRGFLDYGEDE